MRSQLFHVSDRDDIESFVPRTAPTDPDALTAVWAIDEDHLGHQLLPRDCPRVCFRAGALTSDDDQGRLLQGDATARVVAIESAWWPRVRDATLWVYGLPAETFSLLDITAGYYVSTETVIPDARISVPDVPSALLGRGYELRILPSLWALRDSVITSTLEFSIIRWRNASPRGDATP